MLHIALSISNDIYSDYLHGEICYIYTYYMTLFMKERTSVISKAIQ